MSQRAATRWRVPVWWVMWKVSEGRTLRAAPEPTMYAVIDRLNKRVTSMHHTYIAAEDAQGRRQRAVRRDSPGSYLPLAIVQVADRAEADAIVDRLTLGAS